MSLDKILFGDILDLLVPYMSDQRERQAILHAALFGSPLRNNIDWEGRPRSFTTTLINQLITHDGETSDLPSLRAVLKEVKERVGEEQHSYIDSLIRNIRSPGSPREKPPIPQPPNLYALPPYSGASTFFTGRKEELEMLDAWAQGDGSQPMFVLVAIGGMGKSALTWQWMQQQIKAKAFDGVFWYSFYEGGAEMRDCVRHALAYVTRQHPDTLRGGNFDDQLSELIEELQKGRYLLVLDGLERVLVAYHRWDAAQMQDDTINEERKYCDCTNPRDEEALRLLTQVDPSRVLISSRLFPNALLDMGTPMKAVEDKRLEGLSPADARALWREAGITWDKPETRLDQFFKDVGRHGLILKIAGGAINRHVRRRGHFDTWYEDLDGQFDFASKDLRGKRHHILDTAYAGLSQEGKDLLAQIATLGTAVSFDLLNVFNPYLTSSRPEAVEKPDESDLEWYRDELQEADTDEDKARWQAEIDKEESDLKRAQADYAAYLQALRAWEKARKSVLRPFEQLLTELEGRGLLWWDEATDLYDLHPVVRGYAYGGLSDEERRIRHDRSYNLFESQEQTDTDKAATLTELQLPIAMYQALIGAGRLDDAAPLFHRRLYRPLVEYIGAYPKAYELLLPVFSDGLDHLPTLTNTREQSMQLADMGNLLSYLNRDNDALTVKTLSIKLQLDRQDAPDLGVALGNYGLSLGDTNRLVQTLRVLECFRDLTLTNQNREELAFSSLYLLTLYSTLGRWPEVDAAYTSFMENPPADQTDSWRASAQWHYAESLLIRDAPLDQVHSAIDDAQQFAIAGRSVLDLRYLIRLRGEAALKAGQAQQAVALFQEGIERGRQSGIQESSVYGGLARAYLALGQLDRALRIVEEGDNYSAGCVYQAAGQLNKAKKRALKRYMWAWADGEPYVHRYHLDRARDLLVSLGEPIPDLPVWDESRYEKFAYEDEVRAFIDKLKAEKAAKDQAADGMMRKRRRKS